MNRAEIIGKVSRAVVTAGSTFSPDKKSAYETALSCGVSPTERWAEENMLENAVVAERNRSPLCDDTGIPHLIFEIGRNRSLSGELLEAVYEGVAAGLKELPGRPMAVLGSDIERIEQKNGLDERSEAVVPPPPTVIFSENENLLRLTVLMQGGGPEIRATTYRIFHKHSLETVVDEIVSRASEAAAQLGCTPCTLAIGIGRSHYEASSLMLRAMTEGRYDVQSPTERLITSRVNETGIGALGLGGQHTVHATFLKIGPQRASGVRIVSIRPCCCFEPRKASVEL